jgi:glycosyltransferase involved in cell wall biosynthesis
MKIAILGTRGIPGRYGGFETFAEQLSKRLVARGHDVTVYCRRPFTDSGDVVDPRIRRVILPTIQNKYIDTAFHTFLSVIHVVFTDVDLVFLCNVANSTLAWVPRLFGIPTVLHVDGLDRKRRKWNIFAQSYLFLCELLALVTPTRIVTDAPSIHEYFRQRYNKRSAMIAYGAEVPEDSGTLEGFDLPKQKYILYVSRLEPENNPELVIRAYKEVQTDWPLVIVGGNCYDGRFVRRLKLLADRRVIFLGAIYGRRYWQLLQNAGLFVSACEVGGIHPALIEAMVAGNAILYLDTPENQDTATGCGVAFRQEVKDLATQMKRLLHDPGLREKLVQDAVSRAKSVFSWDEVTTQYETLFSELRAGKTATPVRSSVPADTCRPPDTGMQPVSARVHANPVEGHDLRFRVSSAERTGKPTG